MIELGVNAQVTPAGSPVHDKLIGLLKPPELDASMVTEVDAPRVTVADGDESDSEKSVPAAAAGTSVANRPLVKAIVMCVYFVQVRCLVRIGGVLVSVVGVTSRVCSADEEDCSVAEEDGSTAGADELVATGSDEGAVSLEVAASLDALSLDAASDEDGSTDETAASADELASDVGASDVISGVDTALASDDGALDGAAGA